ncbi:hypothetical protein BT96DRAFT_944969 [Gymnopus androsaceus JB14]|uniref:Uncharacterized protein n=1 Tax=Gymnopus androsaceus JB14 TaxID=1447944 RepID=A0A6A4H1R1_9AGAR|nr:hypothetical protein BT96DRAFT_944969 [Gymnopus androsaceus JB14]
MTVRNDSRTLRSAHADNDNGNWLRVVTLLSRWPFRMIQDNHVMTIRNGRTLNPLENSHSLEAEAWTPVQNAFSVKLPFKWVMMQSKLTIGTSEDDVCSDMDEGIQPVYKTVAIQKQKHSCIKYEEDLDESEDEVETHLTNSTPSLRHLVRSAGFNHNMVFTPSVIPLLHGKLSYISFYR